MKIITNTAVSLDGKISVKRDEHFYLGSEADRRRMSEIRALADAVLVGGNSFRNWPRPALPLPEHRSRDCVRAPLWNVVVSRRMDFVLPEAFLAEKLVRPLFLTPASKPAGFPAETVTLDPLSPNAIVAELEARGVKTLLVEAGGDLIAQFIAAGLIDEMHVTLCPKIVGGREAPSLADGRGFSAERLPQLRLLSSRIAGDEVFLHYRVVRG